MAVANVKWFDANVYMGNKLAKMPAGTTMDSLVAQMEKAGYSGPEGYFRHFLDWGHTEDVSPSAGFDAQQYYTFKAAHDYYSGDVSKVTAADVNKIKTAINAAGMDAWTHYQKFGSSEMINASNSFDTAAYLQAKSAAMGGALTAEGVALAIQKAGMNAYEHYMQFKGGAGEVAFDQTFVVASSKQISTAFTLTNGVDVATANVFNAARGWTPGGTDQVNTLDDDDVLTGTGTNPTLNFTFVNDADLGNVMITPTLNGVETVNVSVQGTGNKVLDLQDTTGLENINVSRVSAGSNFTAQNIASASTSLSINNSNAVGSTITFDYLRSALAGTADGTTLTLSNVNVANVVVEQNGATGVDADTGYETINLVSTGSANTITGLFQAEDLQTLNISGTQNLTIAGFGNAAGSLSRIDGSTAEGNLDLSLNGVLSATQDGTSGTNIALTVLTGAGADTIRVTNDTIGTTDSINTGEGNDTLVLQANQTNNFTPATTGAALVTGVENVTMTRTDDLNVTADANDTLTLDLARLAGDQAVRLFNNGEVAANGGADVAGDGVATFNLNNASAGDATGISIQHSSTNNNATASNVVNVDVDAGVTTVAVAIVEGANNDQRFNFTLSADSDNVAGNVTNTVTNVTLTDSDSESNTVRLVEFAAHTGTLTVTGGAAGTFLNLDATANGYGHVQTGAVGDATTAAALVLAANPAITAAGLVQPSSRDTAVATVFTAGVAGGELLVATSIAASAQTSDLVARLGVANTNAQLGSGNDTVIFADRAGITAATSGLTIQDTVAGGAGTDTIVLDGTGAMTLGASEWTNLTGVDVIRLAGTAGATFNLRVTDQLVDQTDSGNRITIINNDGSLIADSENVATINLRALSATNNVTFIGANGDGTNVVLGTGADAAQTVIMNDVTANGSNILNGGDRDVITDYTSVGVGRQFATAALADAAWAANVAARDDGNNNVLQIFNTAEVTIGDLVNTSNFSTINFVNDLATAQTLNLTLDNTTVDRLVDASHTATATQVETLVITATDNVAVPLATANLNVQAATVGAQFALNITGGAGADVIVAGAGADVITGGAGADVINGGLGNDTYIYGATITDSAVTTTATAPAGWDTVTVTAGDTFDFNAAVAAVVAAPVASGVAIAATGTLFIGQLNTAFTGADDGAANVESAVITFTGGEQFLVVDSNSDQAITAADNVVQLVGTVTGISIAAGNVVIA